MLCPLLPAPPIGGVALVYGRMFTEQGDSLTIEKSLIIGGTVQGLVILFTTPVIPPSRHCEVIFANANMNEAISRKEYPRVKYPRNEYPCIE